ncbi:hypothetical protein CEXT_109481 [Caerostris extrusa]|uniref:Uncharacterized protein n=1 Tax=Caerostris extrusa TaxID=172846 RepID=A0AAV4WTF8_CAEEX|nr:hypothetical protein CEXT_109481 [Caerostris extrusa]
MRSNEVVCMSMDEKHTLQSLLSGDLHFETMHECSVSTAGCLEDVFHCNDKYMWCRYFRCYQDFGFTWIPVLTSDETCSELALAITAIFSDN